MSEPTLRKKKLLLSQNFLFKTSYNYHIQVPVNRTGAVEPEYQFEFCREANFASFSFSSVCAKYLHFGFIQQTELEHINLDHIKLPSKIKL